MSKATATIETQNHRRYALTGVAALFVFAAWVLAAAPALACGDLDGDGVCNRDDNCLKNWNPEQWDSDNDGYGDACDCDYNQDGMVDDLDFVEFMLHYGEQVTDESPIADSNGNLVAATNGVFDHTEDGVIGVPDLGEFYAAFGHPVQHNGQGNN